MQKVFIYFKYKFVLGMTATLERSDGFDIYSMFDYNIACDIRLQDAMKADLICPFHYYTILDFMANSEMITDKTDFNKLVLEERVDHIINQIQYYGYCCSKVKELIFVSRVEEAKALSGENKQEEIEEAIIKK